MLKKKGRNTIVFENGPLILSAAGVAGKKEGEGPLGQGIDFVSEDSFFGQKDWEAAESTMQKKAVSLAMAKGGFHPEDIDYIFAGDLLGQSIASSFALEHLNIPFFGVYSACATMGEALSLGAMAVAGGAAAKVIAVTSSHFASAEKEFRFPLNYGNQRPRSATWTTTGSGAVILGSGKSVADQKMVPQERQMNRKQLNQKQPQHAGSEAPVPAVRIRALTIGTIVDYGFKDSMNMGACMAPAAAAALCRNFEDLNIEPDAYDWIFTGDLGRVGQRILIDLMKKEGYDIAHKHRDCGIEIFDAGTQDTHAGGSGCGCSAVTLTAYILPMMQRGTWHRILFMPTGALLSATSFHEGKSIPGIAHGVVLERV